MRNILSYWEYRRLTLIGKIQGIKRLALSQLTYILIPLTTNQNFINEINYIFIVFCNWSNKLSRCVKFLKVTFKHFLETVFLSSCNSGLSSLFQTRLIGSLSKHDVDYSENAN